MDDCSGNVFGKRLIRKYYFNKMPQELATDLEKNTILILILSKSAI
jgi:hypothetical protein